jgi:hypothetical protein
LIFTAPSLSSIITQESMLKLIEDDPEGEIKKALIA